MNFIFNGTVKDIELFSAFINSIKEFPVTKALIHVDNQTGKDIQSVLTLSAPNWSIEYSETLNRNNLRFLSTFDWLYIEGTIRKVMHHLITERRQL